MLSQLAVINLLQDNQSAQPVKEMSEEHQETGKPRTTCTKFGL